MADDKDAGQDKDKEGIEIIKKAGKDAWEKAKGGKG
jgi:hypothetical protein